MTKRTAAQLKRQKFVAAYLKDPNATQAAIDAGYSKKTAYSMGHQLLKHVEIAPLIAAAFAGVKAEAAMNATEIVQQWSRVGRASIADVADWGVKDVAIAFDADGKRLRPEDIADAVMVRTIEEPFVRPINRDDLPEPVRAAIAEVALTAHGFRVKMHDKLGALDKLGRVLRLFSDEPAETQPISFTIILPSGATEVRDEDNPYGPRKRLAGRTGAV